MPADALTRSKGLGDLRFVHVCCLYNVEGAGEKSWGGLVSERHRLLGRKRKGVLVSLIINIFRCGLSRQPFTYVALVQVRLLGKFRRRHWFAVCHRLVESKTIAEQDAGTSNRGAKIANELAHQIIQFQLEVLQLKIRRQEFLLRLQQLRAALDQARAAIGLPAVAYSQAITPQVSVVRALDFREIRLGGIQK